MLYIAIIALIISFIGLIGTIINSVFIIKNFKKSKRDVFFQRRDQLFQNISELSTTSSEAHRISARYEMVIQNLVSVRMEGEPKTRIENHLASIKRSQENLKLRTNHWDEVIEALYFKCNRLKSTEAAELEKLIPVVRSNTDSLKRDNERHFTSLHIFEGINPLLKADVDILHKCEMELAESKLQEAMNEINNKAPD